MTLPTGSRARRWNGCARWMECAACISKPMLLLENKDFREFIELLNSNAVRYLIVGGHAVTFHGFPRFTADLDLWVATDAKNALRVNQALKEFGFGNLFDADDFSRPGYAIQLGRPPYRIDILTSIQGIDFAPAYCPAENSQKRTVWNFPLLVWTNYWPTSARSDACTIWTMPPSWHRGLARRQTHRNPAAP